MSDMQNIHQAIRKEANPEKAEFLQRFFKTSEGQYAEGDLFLGLTVPQSRKIAREFADLPLSDIEKLLQSKYHEERLIALLLLVGRFKQADGNVKKEIFEFYLSHTGWINNWDLVDSSADKIVGEYLWEAQGKEINRDCHVAIASHNDGNEVLERLARSKNLWERRIAMIATFAFILHGESTETLQIAEIVLHDNHDLIQKAVGWMLREVGKRCSEDVEKQFLKHHYKTMPRTALRYAIERFSMEERKAYLSGEI